jgi:hypothetical protein
VEAVSNEAAERLRVWLAASSEFSVRTQAVEDFDAALADERRATVKRIRAAFDADPFFWAYRRPRARFHAILDAEGQP